MNSTKVDLDQWVNYKRCNIDIKISSNSSNIGVQIAIDMITINRRMIRSHNHNPRQLPLRIEARLHKWILTFKRMLKLPRHLPNNKVKRIPPIQKLPKQLLIPHINPIPAIEARIQPKLPRPLHRQYSIGLVELVVYEEIVGLLGVFGLVGQGGD